MQKQFDAFAKNKRFGSIQRVPFLFWTLAKVIGDTAEMIARDKTCNNGNDAVQ